MQVILENLMTLLPFVVIYSFEGGVKWTLGKKPRALGPGFHWKIWFVHEIEVISVVDEYMDLPIQSVITKDGQLVCFSVIIGYKITDPVKHFCEVSDFKEATEGVAMQHLALRVREQNYEELTNDLKALETSLRGTLTTRVRAWGTEIFSVGFTNFAKVPLQFRMFGGFGE